MKTVHVALSVYTRAQAANDEAAAKTLSAGEPHEGAEDAANQPAGGWDPFEVWRTRIKAAQKSDHTSAEAPVTFHPPAPRAT
jgi:hypothetical protein